MSHEVELHLVDSLNECCVWTKIKNDTLDHYESKTNLIDTHLVFTGQAPAVCSDSSILFLHVGLHLSVLGSLLLFT